MASTVTVERSLVDALRYNYPGSASAYYPTARRDSKVDKELKYQVRVHWKDHGNYVFNVKNTMLIADLKMMVQAKTNIPALRQRLSFDGKILDSGKTFHESGFDDGMLRPSALWTQIELEHLQGLCLPDSNVDFWAKVSGSVPEQMLPVHAHSQTLLRDLAMILFDQYPNLPRGRRQLVYDSHVVYDNQNEVGRSVTRTLGDLGLKQGRMFELRMLILPS